MAFVSGPLLPSARPGLARRNVYMCEAKPNESEAKAGRGVSPAKWVPLKKVKSAGKELWRDQYVDIFGARGGGSHPEFDLRPKSERGLEADVCPACEGNGKMQCSICCGLPHIVNGEVVECPSCGGKHEITCSLCGGTGKVVELQGEEWFKKGIRNLMKN